RRLHPRKYFGAQDGKKTDFYGANRQSQETYDANGYVSVITAYSDLPKIREPANFIINTTPRGFLDEDARYLSVPTCLGGSTVKSHRVCNFLPFTFAVRITVYIFGTNF